MTALPQDVVADLRRENARLQAELRTAGDRQAGSAEILRAIASAPGDAERALQQIAETTARLFGATSVTIRIVEGEDGAAQSASVKAQNGFPRRSRRHSCGLEPETWRAQSSSRIVRSTFRT